MDCGYGSPYDPESWLSQSQFLIVRHAYSEENKHNDRYRKASFEEQKAAKTDEVIYNTL